MKERIALRVKYGAEEDDPPSAVEAQDAEGEIRHWARENGVHLLEPIVCRWRRCGFDSFFEFSTSGEQFWNALPNAHGRAVTIDG